MPAGSSTHENEITNARGQPMQVVQCVPAEGAGLPLVVMVHGHGGDVSEAGRFDDVARRLASQGIASLRMQFAGSGTSREDFLANTPAGMLADLQLARQWALRTGPAAARLDADRTALLGFSLGGRLVMLAAAGEPRCRALVLWAPVATDGISGFSGMFGGEEALQEAWRTAQRQGHFDFVLPCGETQRLSEAWFSGLAETRPATALSSFSGPVLLIYGHDDVTVKPETARAAAAAAAGEVTIAGIRGVGHGLGFGNAGGELWEQAVSLTVDWLREKLGC